MPPPPPVRECDDLELNTLALCAKDADEVGCDVTSADAEIKCLLKRQDHLHERCLSALRMYDECLNQPHLLLPMEIASAMLLVTASFTLLCTVLRCCCRKFCSTPGVRVTQPAVSLEQPTELSDTSEDEDPAGAANTGASTRGASASSKAVGAASSGSHKISTPSVEDGDQDDQLPAYTQVVEHSALVVQPLQCGSGPSIN